MIDEEHIWDRYELSGKILKGHGYLVQREEISKTDLKNLLEIDIPYFKNGYSETAVENKLYRVRENHDGRLGDAMIVSFDEPGTMPFISLNNGYLTKTISELYFHYINILKFFVDEEVPDNTKVLLNYQFYKEGSSNSLPFHFDSEIFKGNWGKDYIELEEGLIPKLVMVLVLENDNDGKGLKILRDGEVIDLELNPGDILFFDNTKVLHGVPEDLPKKRTMLGMRSFETKPLYFKKEGLNEKETIKIDTPYVSWEAVELTTEKAKEVLLNEGWYYG